MANYVADGYVAESYVSSGVSIDWGTKVITVPRTSMTLVQVSPIEVRELNLDTFRRTLKDLEDNEPGIVNTDTHVHNPPFTISGIQLARIVEILEPYTVTFEDGQYAVNLVGANTNLQDRVNINQVSIRPTNSAGLVQTAEIEIASFQGGVWYDATVGVSGTAFPTGTPQRPVNNLADALFIGNLRGFNKLYINGIFNLDSGDIISDWDLIGNSAWTDHCHNFSGGTVYNCTLHNLHVAGEFTGNTIFHECRLKNISEVNGEATNCILDGGTNTLAAGGTFHMLDCRSGVIGPGSTTVSCNGDGELGVRGYIGEILLTDKSSGNMVVDLTSGIITLEATITGGDIEIRGIGKLVKNNTGGNIDDSGLISTDEIRYSSYGNRVVIDVDNGVAGTGYDIGTFNNPVNNLADAQAIIAAVGLPKSLFIKGNYDFIAGDDLRDYRIEGEGATMNVSNSIFTLDTGGNVMTSNCEFVNAEMRGRQVGETKYTDCVISGIENAHCKYVRCCFVPPRTGDGVNFTLQHGSFADQTHTTELHDCYSDEGVAVIDRNGARMNQRYVDFSGNLKFINQNHATESGSIYIHMIGGSVEIDSSCTQGEIVITGDCEIINNTGGTNVRTGIFQKIDNVKYSVEAMRVTHQGYGRIFYVDPVNGLDTNNGLSEISALATVMAAHALCGDGENDVIYVINPSSGGYVHNEDILITKNNVHLRVSSRDITLKAATPGGSVITVGDATGTNGYSCSIVGPLIDGDKAGPISANYGITVNGKFCLMSGIWVKQTVLDCILIRGGDYHVITDGEIEKADRHGIRVEDAGLPSGSPREITINGRSNIYLNVGAGISLGHNAGATLGTTTRLIRILSGEITRNGSYGIEAESLVDGLTIGRDVIIHANNGGHGEIQKNILTDEHHDDRVEGYHEAASAFGEHVVEDTYTIDELMRLMSAVLLGQVSGAGTGTETFLGVDGTSPRVISTIDSAGNRITVTLDPAAVVEGGGHGH